VIVARVVAQLSEGGTSLHPLPEHLRLAQLLLAEVAPDRNAYANRNRFILWPGDPSVERAENHSDCSGLIALLLSRAYGYTPRTFKDWMGAFFPTAFGYFDAIRKRNGFRHVKRVSDCQPGDLIAIDYPSNMKNTGHVMLIEERPVRAKVTAPCAPGAVAWDVRVIDSSRMGHGPGDPRCTGEGKVRGIGRGTVRLCTNASGAFVGYAWSTLRSSTYYSKAARPLIVGRCVGPPSQVARKPS
jgi:hypothetical protein